MRDGRAVNLVFTAVLCVCGFYFVGLRKRFDMFSLGFCCTAVYFLPGVVGYDLRGPLVLETYYVFCAVLLSIVASALVSDHVFRSQDEYPEIELRGGIGGITSALALMVTLFILAKHGIGALLVPKTESGIAGVTYIIWRTSASLALIFGVLSGRRGGQLVGAACLLLMFVGHDRTALALTFLAILVHLLRSAHGQPIMAVVRRWIVPATAVALLIWFGKPIHAGIQSWYRTGSWSAFIDVLTAQRVVLAGTEPFAIQLLLNTIIKEHFYIGPNHLVGVLYQLWPVPSMFGHNSSAFNELMQATLFPEARSHSMAYNYWGEGIASGGWIMLTGFIVLYVGGLALFNRLLHVRHLGWRGIALLMGAYWAFYIHRNSLASIVTFERHIFYIGVMVIAVSAILPRRKVPTAVLDPYLMDPPPVRALL